MMPWLGSTGIATRRWTTRSLMTCSRAGSAWTEIERMGSPPFAGWGAWLVPGPRSRATPGGLVRDTPRVSQRASSVGLPA